MKPRDTRRTKTVWRKDISHTGKDVSLRGIADRIRLSHRTAREEQILRLLLFGLAEKEIANRVQLSRHTVHEHVKAIYRSVAVTSRAELMARCLREGFTTDSEGTTHGPASRR